HAPGHPVGRGPSEAPAAPARHRPGRASAAPVPGLLAPAADPRAHERHDRRTVTGILGPANVHHQQRRRLAAEDLGGDEARRALRGPLRQDGGSADPEEATLLAHELPPQPALALDLPPLAGESRSLREKAPLLWTGRDRGIPVHALHPGPLSHPYAP